MKMPPELPALLGEFLADLMPWEVSFCHSLERRCQDGIPLTPKQTLTLDELAQRIIGHGLTISEEELWR